MPFVELSKYFVIGLIKFFSELTIFLIKRQLAQRRFVFLIPLGYSLDSDD